MKLMHQFITIKCYITGSPYTMQVPREMSYEDLQKLILKEMAPTLHDDILTSSQPQGVSKTDIIAKRYKSEPYIQLF